MPVLLRYLLIQLAGWALLGLVLLALHQWLDLSPSIAWAVLGLMVVKDLVLYPWARDAYDDRPGRWVGVDGVVGRRGLVVEALDPTGWVVVAGERTVPGRDGGRLDLDLLVGLAAPRLRFVLGGSGAGQGTSRTKSEERGGGVRGC